MKKPSLLRMLARAFLAGEPGPEQIVARAARVLGRHWRWLEPVARRYVAAAAGRTRPRHRDVAAFLLADEGFRRAWVTHSHRLSVADWLSEPAVMQPVPAALGWNVPPLESPAQLAEWMHVTPAELDWLADLKGLAHRPGHPRLEHYHYRLVTKRSGGIRLIEAPKRNLREIQRRILEEILDRIPPHPAVHGFVKERSIRTFVAPHVGKRVVVRMDLQDFFPSFAAARVQAFFRTLGYPEAVSDLLGGLCTNAAPNSVQAGSLYRPPHLPQGAPTSPALANLLTYRADCRLAGLAEAAGAAYSRYADDLAFSGHEDFAARADRIPVSAAAILLDEGLSVNHRKTRVMRQGVRQHLAGLVTNQRMNVPREDFDQLKAILTNCVRLGPESQNREAHQAFRSHLEGRVGFVESIHPGRGARLRTIFNRIVWQ